jgi:hypothetical protein
VRFLLDEDLPTSVAEAARGLGLDAQSVHELGRRGLSDREQLVFASDEERVLATRNRDDFIRLTVDFFREGRAHGGVLIVPHTASNRAPGRIADAINRWAD